MQIKQGQYNPLWLCPQCGNDFRAWLQLPGEDRREFLRQRPQYEITHLLESCCPRCGYPYQMKAAQ